MVFLLSAVQLLAQNRTVTGKVTDEKGAAVAGASVKAKGSTKGAITGNDGTFSISVPEKTKQLVITGIGLAEQTVDIPSSGVIAVKMAPKGESLDEVLVQVPYGTVKKANVTGSAASVTSKQISNQSVTAVTSALEGLVTGIQATNGGGQPGNNNASIRIRGTGSIVASNAPLYVVNGIPYDGDISSLSTDDIETVDVLKDAAASALYGARASNGLIMITTKKGKKGAAKVTLNLRQGYSNRAIPEYDRLNSPQYYEMAWEAMKNSRIFASGDNPSDAGIFASKNLITSASGLNYNQYNVADDKLIDPVTGKINSSAKMLWNERYEDYLLRTASRTNLNLNVAGASDKNDYFFSVGYLDEKGVMVNSDFKRYTLRLSANSSPLSWLNTGVSLDGAYSNQNFIDQVGNSSLNPFLISRNIAPIYPVFQHDWTTGEIIKDAQGNPIYDYGDPNYAGQKTRRYFAGSNPLGSANLDINNAKFLNANFSAYVELKFLKHFSLKNTFGGNYYTETDKSYLNKLYGASYLIGGSTTISNSNHLSSTINQVLSWANTYSKNNFRVLFGHEAYSNQISYLEASGKNNLYNDLNDLASDSSINNNPYSTNDKLNIEGYFSNFNYDYDGKYLFSASYRKDGSSRFKTNRWGDFYSFGIGWRVSQEHFLTRFKWINDLKLRASYGQQGNENINAPESKDGKTYSVNYYIDRQWYYPNANGAYVAQTHMSNPNLKWENNMIFNVGLDFSLFNKRLQGTVEFFNRKTKNMIFDVPLMSATGFNSIYMNAGSMKNYGVEISLGYNVISKKNFDWRVDLNLTSYKNEVLEIPDALSGRGFQSGMSRIIPGQPVYNFYYLRNFKGVDPSTGLALYLKDVNDASGKIVTQKLTDIPTDASYYYQGNPIPKFNGGLTNSLKFRNIEFSCITTFSYGGQFYDDNYAGLMAGSNSTSGNNWHTDILNRWQKVGDITNVPRVQLSASQFDAASTRFLFDASWLNIKNVAFTYFLPKAVTSKLSISDLNFKFSVDNVWLFTNKRGSNPQQGFSGRASAAYPPMRTVNFGLSITF